MKTASVASAASVVGTLAHIACAAATLAKGERDFNAARTSGVRGSPTLWYKSVASQDCLATTFSTNDTRSPVTTKIHEALVDEDNVSSERRLNDCKFVIIRARIILLRINMSSQQVVATFFIGGAADKTRFWGVIPQTNLVKSQLISRYLTALAASRQSGLELNNSLEKMYWGYDEMPSLLEAIKQVTKTHPAARIRLVGHSLGAWQAAKLSAQLAKSEITTALLITLDPVGIAYFLKITGSETLPPQPVATTWINILANHTIAYTQDDAIADAGVRWQPARDILLKKKPQSDYAVPNSHADVWEMMTFPGIKGQSAWQILTNP